MNTSLAATQRLNSPLELLARLFERACGSNYMKEVWKDIRGYKGLYQISNLGRVKSLKRKRWNGLVMANVPFKIKKPTKDNLGYFGIKLWKFNIGKTFRIHRLIAIYFISNPKNHNDIDHINRIRTDNSLSNLRWCSRSENCLNSSRGDAHKIKMMERIGR